MLGYSYRPKATAPRSDALEVPFTALNLADLSIFRLNKTNRFPVPIQIVNILLTFRFSPIHLPISGG